MLERAQVVISIDPSRRAAVVTIAGPLPQQAAGVVRQVLRRAATIAGPSVTVDLQGCTLLHPAVVECLLGEHERLRAWGGALVCGGIDAPAARSAGAGTGTAAALAGRSRAAALTVPVPPEGPAEAVDVVDQTGAPAPEVSRRGVEGEAGLLAGAEGHPGDPDHSGPLDHSGHRWYPGHVDGWAGADGADGADGAGGGSPVEGWAAALTTQELGRGITEAIRRRTVAFEEVERSASGRLLIALLEEADRRQVTAHG